MTDDTSPSDADREIAREKIAKLSEQIVELSTHPAFLEMVREINEAPPAERLQVAERVGRVEALEEHGLTPPDGFRITTRYFEDPQGLLYGSMRTDITPAAVKEVLKPGEVSLHTVTVCVSLGVGICASIGGVV